MTTKNEFLGLKKMTKKQADLLLTNKQPVSAKILYFLQ